MSYFENRKKQEPEKTDYHEFSGSCFSKSTCSASDCTGLIPALPQDEAQLESYQDLYPFNPEDGSAKPKSVR